MSSHLKGPSEGDWSVFAEKVVAERDAAREEVARLTAKLKEAEENLHDEQQWTALMEAESQAMSEGSNAWMRQVLGAERYVSLWGPDLEGFGRGVDELRGRLKNVESRLLVMEQENKRLRAVANLARTALLKCDLVVGLELLPQHSSYPGSVEQRAVQRAQAAIKKVRVLLSTLKGTDED